MSSATASPANTEIERTNRKRKKCTTDNEPVSSKQPTDTPTSTTETPVNPKKRIKKYCPDAATYNLDCEWKQCSYTSSSMDDYLAHVDEHLDEYSGQNSCKQRN